MTDNQLQLAVKRQIQKRERANKMTFIGGTFSVVYGMTFAYVMPGVESIVLGSIITLFGLLVFSFSVVAKNNK